MAVASVTSVVAGVGTFFATRHPYFAFEVMKATFAGLGGAAVGGLLGTGGTVVVEKITEEDEDKTKKKQWLCQFRDSRESETFKRF